MFRQCWLAEACAWSLYYVLVKTEMVTWQMETPVWRPPNPKRSPGSASSVLPHGRGPLYTGAHTHKHEGIVILECDHTSYPELTFRFKDSGVRIGSRSATQAPLPPSRFAWMEVARTSVYTDLKTALLNATTMG